MNWTQYMAEHNPWTGVEHNPWTGHVWGKGEMATAPTCALANYGHDKYIDWNAPGGMSAYKSGLVNWRIGVPGFNHSGSDINFRIESDDSPYVLSRCSYCGAEWHPSRFHPGSCDECGGPR